MQVDESHRFAINFCIQLDSTEFSELSLFVVAAMFILSVDTFVLSCGPEAGGFECASTFDEIVVMLVLLCHGLLLQRLRMMRLMF